MFTLHPTEEEKIELDFPTFPNFHGRASCRKTLYVHRNHGFFTGEISMFPGSGSASRVLKIVPSTDQVELTGPEMLGFWDGKLGKMIT